MLRSIDALLKVYEEILPPVLWRHKWKKYQAEYGVPYSRGTMQNADCLKAGPRKAIVGGKVCYLKEDYLAWAAKRFGNSERAQQ